MFADKLSNPFLKPSPFLSGNYSSQAYSGAAMPSMRHGGYLGFDQPKINSYANISTSAYPSVEPIYPSRAKETVDLGQILSNNPFNRPTTGVFSASRANQDLSPGKYSSNWNGSSQRPTSYASSNAYSDYKKTYQVVAPKENGYMNRQSQGRHTPQKKYDNYLSTSSADSAVTYINKIYEVEEDRSDVSSAAISNPFFRKNLLQEKTYEREAKPKNSYDSAALKYSYQSDDNKGYEAKGYQPTEDFSSKYDKYEYKRENPSSKSYLPANYEPQYEPKYEQKYEPVYEKQYTPKYQTKIQQPYQSYSNEYQTKPLSNPFDKKYETKKFEPVREETLGKPKSYANIEVPTYQSSKYQKYGSQYDQNHKYGKYESGKYGEIDLNGGSGKYGEQKKKEKYGEQKYGGYKKQEDYGGKNDYKFSDNYEKFDFDEDKDYDRNWKEQSKKGRDSDPYDSYRVSFKPSDSSKELPRDSQKNYYEQKPDIYQKYHHQEDYAGAFQTLGGQKSSKSKEHYNPQSVSHLDRREPTKLVSSQVEQYEHPQPLQQKFAKRQPAYDEYHEPPKPRSQNKIIKFDEEEEEEYERPVKQRTYQTNKREEYPRVLQIHGLLFHKVEIC